MAEGIRMQFEKLPSLAGRYVKALLSRKPAGLRSGTIPRIEASVPAVPPDAAALKAYREVCAFPEGPDVPPTWPMVMAGPLHLAILTAPAFPMKAMGIIHVRNVLTLRRAIPATATVSVRAWVDGHRDVPSGVEFDLFTEVSMGGEIAWDGVTTILSRVPGRKPADGKKGSAPAPSLEPSAPVRHEVWAVKGDTGRRYAAASGDYNPIHLHPTTAKMLGGFPHPIAHGMWTMARAVAAMGEAVPKAPVRIDVEFRRPVYLPSGVVFSFGPQDGGQRYAVRAIRDDKVCLAGNVTQA